MAVFFVSRVMPAWSIGTGNLKRKFLFVKVVARQFESRHANEYNTASFPAHKRRLVNGFVAPGSRGDENGIDAAPPRKAIGAENGVFASRQIDRLSPERLRQPQFLRIEVYA
jgi:hypothetical protein